MNNNQYEPVIGLEIHLELKTKSKMFCGCDADHFSVQPNTHCCPVCLGLPGALPVPNKRAVEWTVLLGMALNCHIASVSKFDRKNYAYPDLPKGYQISQYDEPIAVNGFLDFEKQYGTYLNDNKRFRIHRVHLEEDTGKLVHEDKSTLIDFNRSGVPLVEIVTEPDFKSSLDVKMFLEELHTIIRYLNISDADLEKGSMRMEPNISVRLASSTDLPQYKVEVKNINSFNFVKRAVEYEVARQISILEKGGTPVQETRGWDSNRNLTYSQRSKEGAHEYRYFPEPDIPPFTFSKEYIKSIKEKIPELPQARIKKYLSLYNLKTLDAFILTRNSDLADYFDQICAEAIKRKDISGIKRLEQLVANAIINKRIPTSFSPAVFINRLLEVVRPKETDIQLLANVVIRVIQENAKVVADYKVGKQNAIMFLVGQVMKEMKGKADAIKVRAYLEKELGNS